MYMLSGLNMQWEQNSAVMPRLTSDGSGDLFLRLIGLFSTLIQHMIPLIF